MNQFLGKFVVSPFDGIEYCRKNGQFLEHIRSLGYDYQTLFEKFNPNSVQFCSCGQKCVFNIRKMVYKQTCGTKECANAISRTKRANRTEQQWDDWRQKYNAVMASKTREELADIVNRRIASGTQRGSYKASVPKREKTCLEQHGDKKYNNAEKISSTKLSWDASRKQLFKDRLTLALGGRALNDFHTEDMFAARRRMLEERGDVIPHNQLSEWEQYSQTARKLTERTYRAHQSIINPKGFQRGEYELDHIVPIYYGFQNDIPVELISSVNNLQMLPKRTNRAKGKKYDPTTSTKHKELEN